MVFQLAAIEAQILWRRQLQGSLGQTKIKLRCRLDQAQGPCPLRAMNGSVFLSS